MIPSTGGSPIKDAIAKPYGKAINAAMSPPEQSPSNPDQPYPDLRFKKGEVRLK
jgi:hypothetical protein